MLFRLCLFAFCVSTALSVVPRYLGNIATENPGFTNFFEHANPSEATERYTLIFSSFLPVPFITEYTKIIRYVGKYLADLNSTDIREISNKPLWPREPSQVPTEVFGHEAVAQPDGFLVPGKTDGSLKIIDLSDWNNPVTHDITSDPNGNQFEWFYHRALWFDVNGDGRIDAVTNHANRDIDTGGVTSEFLWYEHPEGPNPLGQRWASTVIHQNLSDTFLYQERLSAGGKLFETILTVGYFSNQLLIHWSTAPDGSWANPADITWRAIDTGCRFFDVALADVNVDGKRDIIVTCNAVQDGSLIVYEVPDDFRTGEYTKHVLKRGFNVVEPGEGSGAPGSFVVFYPNVNVISGKPLIALSGDDSGFAYILTPKSQDPSDWEYDMETILNEGDGNIVGKLSVADVNGDGYTELFAPSYYNDQIHVFSFSPEPL